VMVIMRMSVLLWMIQHGMNSGALRSDQEGQRGPCIRYQ
jgi:hypothetical protein